MRIDYKTTPLVRVNQLKSNLEAVALLSEEQKGQVIRGISSEVLESIENEGRTGWLPVAYDLEMTEAVWRVVGDSGVHEWGRESTVKAMQTSLIGSLLHGAVKLFKMDPETALKIAPMAWKSSFRNFGKITYQMIRDNQVELRLVDMPLDQVNSRPYFLGFAGAFEAFIVLGGFRGSVVMESVSKADKQVVFKGTWIIPAGSKV